jgi:thiol-disulfide isomerase/thioredoxin
VNFWATWCAPCRREIPLLEKIQAEHGAEGFQVIGIAADYRDKVLAYADEIGLDYPLLIGEQEALDAAASFGVEAVGLPFTVFSDKQGRIVAAHLGELTEPEAEIFLGAVRQIDAGSLSPEQARGEIEAALARLPPESNGPG